MLLKIKPKARPSDKLVMIATRKVVSEIFAQHGMTVWLTSGMDGEHGVGSLHYAGYAEDYDGTREISDEEWQEIENECRDRLPAPYQWIAHKGHLHCEYDSMEFQHYKYHYKKEY